MKLHRRYRQLNYDICFAKFIIFSAFMALVILIGWRIAFNPNNVFDLVASAAALLAAYSVALTSDRQATHEEIKVVEAQMDAENNKNLENTESMHEMIFLAKDLRQLVKYLESSFGKTCSPVECLAVHSNIRQRYEQICAVKAFKWMPGNIADQITGLSGDIFGITVLCAQYMERHEKAGIKKLDKNEEMACLMKDAASRISNLIEAIIIERDKLEQKNQALIERS